MLSRVSSEGTVGMGIVDDEFDTVDHIYARHPLVRFGAIGEGWRLFTDRWPMWMLAVLIVLAGNTLIGGLIFSFFRVDQLGGPGAFWMGLSPGGRALQAVLTAAVNGLFLGGLFRMACQQIRGRDVGLATLFGALDVLPQLILASVLYGLATFLGFCLLVVPGFIVSGLLMFTIPLIADGGLPATEALGQSWQALKHQWLPATVFHIVAGFVAWVGVLFCGVGFLVTAPLYCLSIAVLYRDFFMFGPVKAKRV